MFEVLVFVYENYYAGENYPEPALLERKLNAVGFASDEIEDALAWLHGLNTAARGLRGPHLRLLRSLGFANLGRPVFVFIPR
jgi:Smg protein